MTTVDRRRPFDNLESQAVRLLLEDQGARALVEPFRYALALARLTVVRREDGGDVDVSDALAAHAGWVRRQIEGPLHSEGLRAIERELPELIRRTQGQRARLLEHFELDRASLEEEVTTRLMAVVSGGGGGAGYVYPGCYEMLERGGLIPDLMVGTSIGALMAMFRCRRRRWDMAPFVGAARKLSWGGVFRVFETQSRYGLPATLRLHLQSVLGHLFRTPEGRPMRMSDMGIPLYVIATGITVDALKHDLDYYEHLLDAEVRRRGASARGSLKTLAILREFMARPDALKLVVLGRDAGTEHFDVLDAAGFSAAIPAVIHYDVLRDAPMMKSILDRIYASYGITRLGEGGLVSNVPARVAWQSIVDGKLGRRTPFVVALDCFAPTRKRLAWYPFQQAVRTANVEADRKFADLYLPLERTPSPLNLVPTIKEALTAIRWGREAMRPHLPYVQEMMRPLPVLGS